jgi:hypothetical protein
MIVSAQVDHAYRYRPPPEFKFRTRLWKVVNSTTFDVIIIGAIVVNMLLMACTFDGITSYWQQLLERANKIFTAVFLLEAVMKLVVYRIAYFKTSWNKFDFFVVTAATVDVIMEFTAGKKSKALTVAP